MSEAIENTKRERARIRKRGRETSQQVQSKLFHCPPSETAGGGRNEFPWSALIHVLPWTPTTVSAGGLSRRHPSRLHFGRVKTLGDENKRVCCRALERFWQCLAALLDLHSSLGCQFFFSFYFFPCCRGSSMKGWQNFTRAGRQKLGK